MTNVIKYKKVMLCILNDKKTKKIQIFKKKNIFIFFLIIIWYTLLYGKNIEGLDMETKYIAYCGYNCKKCPVYIATINEDIDLLRQIVITPGVSNRELDIKNIGCFGCCNNDSVNHLCLNCTIRLCAKEKNIQSCGYCNEFPCVKLNYISSSTMDYLKSINENFKKRRWIYEKNN